MERAPLFAVLIGVSLAAGCADKPPAVIEDRSVLAEEDIPEVRQAATNITDYGSQLTAWRYPLRGGFSFGDGLPDPRGTQCY